MRLAPYLWPQRRMARPGDSLLRPFPPRGETEEDRERLASQKRGDALQVEAGAVGTEIDKGHQGLRRHADDTAGDAQTAAAVGKTADKECAGLLQAGGGQRRLPRLGGTPSRSEVPLLGQRGARGHFHERAYRAAEHRQRNHQEAYRVHHERHTPTRHPQPAARGGMETTQPRCQAEKGAQTDGHLHPDADRQPDRRGVQPAHRRCPQQRRPLYLHHRGRD